jgi:DNA-binding transcriptional LysR family regulator
LTNDRLAVALPGEHRLAAQSKIKLKDLAEQTFVMFARPVSPAYYDSIIAACHEKGFSPRILHEVRTVAAQVAFVGCGQGVAFVPSALKHAASQGVVIRPLAEKVHVVTAAAWSTTRMNPALNLALEVLREQA